MLLSIYRFIRSFIRSFIGMSLPGGWAWLHPDVPFVLALWYFIRRKGSESNRWLDVILRALVLLSNLVFQTQDWFLGYLQLPVTFVSLTVLMLGVTSFWVPELWLLGNTDSCLKANDHCHLRASAVPWGLLCAWICNLKAFGSNGFFFFVFCLFLFLSHNYNPEVFTTMVANKGLEKAGASFKPGPPGTNSLMSPPKDTKVTLLNFWAECSLERKWSSWVPDNNACILKPLAFYIAADFLYLQLCKLSLFPGRIPGNEAVEYFAWGIVDFAIKAVYYELAQQCHVKHCYYCVARACTARRCIRAISLFYLFVMYML